MEKLSVLDRPNTHPLPSIEPIDSFDNIYKRYVGKVYQKCLAMIHDPEVAKDFTQDIFIKVFVKLNTFENRSAFSTWLYAISHNYCIDYLRATKRTESLTEAIVTEVSEQDQTETPATSQWQALSLFMNNLPDEEVAMLRMKYEEGLSVKLISQLYNLSESSVKMRLKRSRDKLRLLCLTAISDKEKHFRNTLLS
ncbi:RNA polymerase sigma factor [Spirosoma terrae]|uniref:Sigma-70 family RNA polymerase sigma factor n=1 Tax=Spirosoma terrae TaxID=1968276 RepID=A0A6L9LA81_9BACT|nr:sigma-70 family RNA polymerase sigma factor [Spirosoma terrae]NDU96387.1 sigma-70 family RNA polymerase sigma factor [Spirosoma terrae]